MIFNSCVSLPECILGEKCSSTISHFWWQAKHFPHGGDIVLPIVLNMYWEWGENQTGGIYVGDMLGICQ